MRRLVCLSLVGLLLPAARSAAAEPAAVKVEKGVTYATADGAPLKLDIAVPTAAGPHPALLLLHGGAWQVGDRSDLSRAHRDAFGAPAPSVIQMLAAKGYVVATASYRLAPKHKFPAQLDDARAALRHLRAAATKYKIDPERVAVGGFSAGAHLALLAGLSQPTAGAAGAAGAVADRVACVISYFGPTDLSLYGHSPGIEDAFMVPLLGKACKTDPQVYRQASPIHFVSPDDPPVLLIHGTADVIVPIIHSERMEAKLREAGVKTELVTVKGEGHGWNGKAQEQTTAETLRFLDQHLKGKK